MGWQRFSIEFSSLHFRHHGSGLRSRDAPEPMASAARGQQGGGLVKLL